MNLHRTDDERRLNAVDDMLPCFEVRTLGMLAARICRVIMPFEDAAFGANDAREREACTGGLLVRPVGGARDPFVAPGGALDPLMSGSA